MKIKVSYCRLCGIIWLERPFVCDCRANVFLKDFETTSEEIEICKQKGAIIKEDTTNNFKPY